ncbi:trans-sialidase, putative [Trypanosoma cruzi]|nr:trans-sialidase, putative [Trypanosoma cruzi]
MCVSTYDFLFMCVAFFLSPFLLFAYLFSALTLLFALCVHVSEAMRRGVKRAARAGNDCVPVTRRRLRDRAEEEAEEKKRRLQQEAAAGGLALKNEEEEWEDTTDDEQEEEEDGSVDEGLDGMMEEEIIDEGEDEDEDYAEFQREADAVTKGLGRITFDESALQQQLNEGAMMVRRPCLLSGAATRQRKGRSSSFTPTRRMTPFFSCALNTHLSPLMCCGTETPRITASIRSHSRWFAVHRQTSSPRINSTCCASKIFAGRNTMVTVTATATTATLEMRGIAKMTWMRTRALNSTTVSPLCSIGPFLTTAQQIVSVVPITIQT